MKKIKRRKAKNEKDWKKVRTKIEVSERKKNFSSNLIPVWKKPTNKKKRFHIREPNHQVDTKLKQ